MRAACFSLALATCALLASTPSQAQRAANLSGRDIPPAERARDTMNRYAVCLVDARQRSVERALALSDQAERRVELARIASNKCLASGEIGMSEPLFRGALYRALYLEKFGRDRPHALDRVNGETAPPDPMQAFGYCVTGLAPAAAHALVVARPVTPEENAALAELGPALADCVAPGEQVGFSRSVLQAVLAEAMYKRATMAAGAGSRLEDEE